MLRQLERDCLISQSQFDTYKSMIHHGGIDCIKELNLQGLISDETARETIMEIKLEYTE